MHALSMSETRSKGYETLIPARSVESKPEQFGKLLNEKQQPRPERTEAPKQVKQVKQVEQVERSENLETAEQRQPVTEPQLVGNEQKAPQKELADKPAAAPNPPAQGAQPLQMVRQLLTLLQTIAAAESPQATEQFGSIETQLTQLVEQLDSVALPAEQMLDGIDLTQLVEQLQAISASSAGKIELAQLATELDTQLNAPVELLETIEWSGDLELPENVQLNAVVELLEPAELNDDADLLVNAELNAVSMSKADPQLATQSLTENLAQVRQVLQKVIALLNGQNPAAEQPVVATEAARKEAMVAAQPLAVTAESQIEARFASLLTPRPENQQNLMSLRERVQQHNAAPVATANPARAGEQLSAEAATKAATKAEPAAAASIELFSAAKLSGENLQQLPGQGLQQPPPVANLRGMPTNPTIVQLPSGQQVAESQIFDQVVTRMSGSFNGESGKMVLRLQPAELGSLKLELVVEGDKVRANLVAQSQQVQEVLERNLPQLRSALAEQGLKIDQFRVDVDQHQHQQQSNQFEQQAQQQQRERAAQRAAWQQPQVVEELVPLAHLLENGGAGISLRV